MRRICVRISGVAAEMSVWALVKDTRWPVQVRNLKLAPPKNIIFRKIIEAEIAASESTMEEIDPEFFAALAGDSAHPHSSAIPAVLAGALVAVDRRLPVPRR